MLFAFGLLNASLFAASILPLSTAHVICEGLGFEAGIDHKFREAPVFYWLYTILIVVGGGIVLLPNAPLWKILIFSQVGNGDLAADRDDIHFAAGEPEGFDGGVYEYGNV